VDNNSKSDRRTVSLYHLAGTTARARRPLRAGEFGLATKRKRERERERGRERKEENTEIKI